MYSQAVNSQGTLLKIGDGGSPETFTTIAEVKDIEGPGQSKSTEDVTSHDSPNGYREYKATLKDGGEVSFELNWFGDGTHEDLQAAFESDDPTNFQLVFPMTPEKTCTFAANVTELGPSAPVEGVLTQEVTLQITGKPTWS